MAEDDRRAIDGDCENVRRSAKRLLEEETPYEE